MKMAHSLLAIALVGLAALLCALPVTAQERPADGPPPAAAPRIDLGEAVATTLRQSYQLRLAEARALRQEGVWKEASGLFDGVVFADFDFSYVQEDLVSDEVNNEIRRRVPAEFAAIATPDGPPGALDRAADQIERGIADTGHFIVDDCGETQSRLIVDVANLGSTVTLCIDGEGVLRGTAIDNVAVSSADLDELIGVLSILEAMGGDFERELQQAIRDLLTETASILRQTAEALRIQRARLGRLPTERELMDLRLEFGHRRQLRNGVGISASFSFIGAEDEFDGKSRATAFGGTLSPSIFTAAAAARLVVPLGKGRGRTATTGPERAAEVAFHAQRQLILHTASGQALETVRNYLRLAAAAERVLLLERSADTQQQIVDTTQELIRADELPGAELSRAEARYNDTLRTASQARQELLDAQFDLVETLGGSVDRPELAPQPASGLPQEGQGELDPKAWVEQAVLHRHDLAAAAAASEASTILEATSKTELRPRVDFTASASYGGLYESFGQGIYDFDGYWNAVRDKLVGPSYIVGLRFGFPFRNREARGRLLQASAARGRSEVTERDLERQIRLKLHDLAGSLENRRGEVARLREAATSLEETLNASRELFKIGDIPLIDLLTTEELLTDTRLALVEARRELAITEAEVRFESGTLLGDSGESREPDPRSLGLAYDLFGPMPEPGS